MLGIRLILFEKHDCVGIRRCKIIVVLCLACVKWDYMLVIPSIVKAIDPSERFDILGVILLLLIKEAFKTEGEAIALVSEVENF